MAWCKLCGKRVTAALVMHRKCLEEAAERIALEFCLNNCKWFAELGDDGLNQHCDGCQMGHLAEALGARPARRLERRRSE